MLDPHLLTGAAQGERLPKGAVAVIADQTNELFFGVVSIWEVLVKRGLGRGGLKGKASRLRVGLLASSRREFKVSARHVLAVRDLPLFHADPFDRLLVAQARVEDLTLMTADAAVARSSAAILKV